MFVENIKVWDTRFLNMGENIIIRCRKIYLLLMFTAQYLVNKVKHIDFNRYIGTLILRIYQYIGDISMDIFILISIYRKLTKIL